MSPWGEWHLEHSLEAYSAARPYNEGHSLRVAEGYPTFLEDDLS